MAEPTIELDAQDENTSSPTYDIAIINGGTVDTTKVIRFGGSNSADGAIENVTIPTSGNKWAEELWLEDTDGTDILLSDVDPDQATQPYPPFKLSTDATAFATAPKISVYDSSSGGETEEVCVGTTNHTSPFLKGYTNTTGNQPSQYWGESTSADLHTKEVAGANSPNGLCGATNYLECNGTDLNGTPEYFGIWESIPDDATTGTDVIDCILRIEYTYT